MRGSEGEGEVGRNVTATLRGAISGVHGLIFRVGCNLKGKVTGIKGLGGGVEDGGLGAHDGILTAHARCNGIIDQSIATRGW